MSKPKRKNKPDLAKKIIAELKKAQVRSICGDVLLFGECVRIVRRVCRKEKVRKTK